MKTKDRRTYFKIELENNNRILYLY